MNQDTMNTKLDRMRYTKDKLPANLLILAIVVNALYFVNIYQSDVGSYFYTWQTGASIIYNLIFMLAAFLASEGVKNRQTGYSVLIAVLGVMQFARVFYIPTKAHQAVVQIAEAEIPVMDDSQFTFLVACLILSGAMILVAGLVSWINNRKLASYMRSIQI